MAYHTPILLLIFNRLETIQQVFQQIKKVEPKQLFIVADGPRENKEGEKEKCEIVRTWVLNAVDWKCDVKTLFRNENKGCGKGVSEGISWFFKHVDEGIILEDDVLVELSFFSFCSEMLAKYSGEQQIMSISATNLMYGKMQIPDSSYFFSSYGGNWGWATWKNRWNKFDYQINEWNTTYARIKLLKNHGYNQYLYFQSLFNAVVNGKRNDVWDYQWWFCMLNNSGLTIIPSNNLMQNIGFGADATHTFDVRETELKIPVVDLIFPLKEPPIFKKNSDYENGIINKFYSLKLSVWQKIKLLRKILH